MNIGDRVRIERDETRYPSKGTWPQFRGKTGTVVEINTDTKHPHLTEYGIVFGSTRRRPNGSLHGNGVTTWFKAYELAALAAVCPAGVRSPVAPIDATRKGRFDRAANSGEPKVLAHV
jgi:hypothetical protein